VLSSLGDKIHGWTDNASSLWIHFMHLCKECIKILSQDLSGLGLHVRPWLNHL